MKKFNIYKILILSVVILSELFTSSTAFSQSQDKRFKNFEIRVIRPKYFTKRGKFELGLQGSLITNQTFIYTFMASGIATMHLTEALGIEASGTYGFSIDKTDKTTLKEEFNINTIIFRTEYMVSGSLLWTPIYGKFQTDEGSLIYFDTFLTFGGGMTGIDYQYDHCSDPSEAINPESVPDKPAPQTVSYPTGIVGLGQRFFTDKKSSFRWDIKVNFFSVNLDDGACDQEAEPTGATSLQQNVIINVGTSWF